MFRESGLKVATQNYEYQSSGNVYTGQNVYSVIHAPRGDGTEAMVLIAAWKTVGGELNLHGVALALTLARYFKRLYPKTSIDLQFYVTNPFCLNRLVFVVKRHYIPHHTG